MIARLLSLPNSANHEETLNFPIMKYIWRPKLAAICAVVGATIGFTSATADAAPVVPAAAGSTDGSGSVIDSWVSEIGPTFLQNQDKLDQFAAWIEGQPGYTDSGYLGQNDAPASLSTTLLWNNSDAFLTDVETEGARRGISLSVQYRPYSREEIARISDELFAGKAALRAAGFDLQMVEGLPAENVHIQAEGVLSANSTLESVQKVVAGMISAPVDIVSGSRVQTTSTRQNDSSPFNAGDFIWSRAANGELCSTGFSYNYQGRAHTSTARHCNPSDGNFWSYDGGSTSTTNRQGGVVATTSAGAMNLLAGTGSSFAYDGAWNNSTGYSKGVHDVEKVNNGDRVCTGGGNSGEHCSIEIESQTVTFNDGFGNISTVEGYQVNGSTAVAGGDSGGPVIVPITSGSASGDVHAVGIIQGSYDLTASSCPSLAYKNSSVGCAPTVLFSYVATAIGGTPSLTLNTD